MNIQEFHNTINQIYYTIYDKVGYAKLKKDELVYKLLRENRSYKNKYSGRRCFILGNGPSLKSIDFHLLKDECVFTVNLLAKYEHFGELNPMFHLLMDGALWGAREDVKNDLQETINMVNALPSRTTLIVPTNAYDFFERKRYKLKPHRQISYVRLGAPFVNGYRTIDMQYNIPTFRTVVQYAIVIALYMGFKEIYLLGCDGTIVVYTLNERIGGELEDIHAYKNDAMQRSATKQINENIPMDVLLYDQYCIFNDYKGLADECKQRGTKLCNLTEPSLVNYVQKGKLDQILR